MCTAIEELVEFYLDLIGEKELVFMLEFLITLLPVVKLQCTKHSILNILRIAINHQGFFREKVTSDFLKERKDELSTSILSMFDTLGEYELNLNVLDTFGAFIELLDKISDSGVKTEQFVLKYCNYLSNNLEGYIDHKKQDHSGNLIASNYAAHHIITRSKSEAHIILPYEGWTRKRKCSFELSRESLKDNIVLLGQAELMALLERTFRILELFLLKQSRSAADNKNISLRFPIETIYPIFTKLNDTNKSVVLDMLNHKINDVGFDAPVVFSQDYFLQFILAGVVERHKNNNVVAKDRLKESLYKILHSFLLNQLEDEGFFSYNWISIISQILANDSSYLRVFSLDFWLNLSLEEYSEALVVGLPFVNSIFSSFLFYLKSTIFSLNLTTKQFKQIARLIMHQVMLNLCSVGQEELITMANFSMTCSCNIHSVFEKFAEVNFLEFILNFFDQSVLKNVQFLDIDHYNEEKDYLNAIDRMGKMESEKVVQISEVLIFHINEDLKKPLSKRNGAFTFGCLVIMISAWKIDKLVSQYVISHAKEGKLSCKIILQRLNGEVRRFIRIYKLNLIILELILASRQRRGQDLYRNNYKFAFFYTMNFCYEKLNQLKAAPEEVLDLFVSVVAEITTFFIFMVGYCHSRFLRMEIAHELSKQSMKTKIDSMTLHILLVDLYSNNKGGWLIDIPKFDDNRRFYLSSVYGSNLIADFERVILMDIEIKRKFLNYFDLDFPDFRDRIMVLLVEEKNLLSSKMVIQKVNPL